MEYIGKIREKSEKTPTPFQYKMELKKNYI